MANCFLFFDKAIPRTLVHHLSWRQEQDLLDLRFLSHKNLFRSKFMHDFNHINK